MSLKYLVNIYAWENPIVMESNSDFQAGDKIVIDTEFGLNIAEIKSLGCGDKLKAEGSILRKANEKDLEIFEKNNEKEEEILNVSRGYIKELSLMMKLIDVRIMLDGSNIVVFFTADGRVDFRELVKNLSKEFHRSIRMQQIGSRDEARRLGGCGICGRQLCCVQFSGDLPSISTEMARIQQVSHRGTERISGLCGRLMCCLEYEADQYRQLLEGMPEVRSTIATKEGKGEVIEVNAITQEIKVRITPDKIVTINKSDL